MLAALHTAQLARQQVVQPLLSRHALNVGTLSSTAGAWRGMASSAWVREGANLTSTSTRSRRSKMTVREAQAIKAAEENQPENAQIDAKNAQERIEQVRLERSVPVEKKYNPVTIWVATRLAKLIGRFMPSYRAAFATNKLYDACADIHEHQAWFWYGVCGLPRTFQTWWSITAIHVWMLHVRIRTLPKSEGANLYAQELTNHFFLDAEKRMQTEYHIKRERLVKRFMKDIHQQHRGLVLALDEALSQHSVKKNGAQGIVQPDYKFSAALWRCIWGAGGFARGFDAVGGVTAKVADSPAASEAEQEADEKARREAEVELEAERAKALEEGKPDPFLPVMPVPANTTLYSGRVVAGQFEVPTEAASNAISDAVDFPELAFPLQLEIVTEYVHRELRRLVMRTNEELYAGRLFAQGDPMNPKAQVPEETGMVQRIQLQVIDSEATPEDVNAARTRNRADEGLIEGSIFGQL